MNDYISRQEALIAIQNLYPGMPFLPSVRKDWREKNDSFIRCEEAIIKLPAADAQPVRHEHWGSKNECSGCGCQPWYERDIRFLHYCPNCGARMDGAT